LFSKLRHGKSVHFSWTHHKNSCLQWNGD
jgi:hypothetical protein